MTTAARYAFIIASLSLALCQSSSAQVSISLPLEGYYRPGKYMPVRLTAPAATAGPVVVRADGAVTVSVETGPAPLDVVVPWLAVESVRSLRWEITGAAGAAIDAPLTRLEDDQVLVGMVGADAGASSEAVAPLFPGKSIVPIRLTGTPPLAGYAAAWETLDAVVFDSPDSVLLGELLEQGTSVVVRSEARPDGPWPWAGRPGAWYVSFDIAGPRGALQPGAYAPLNAWHPGWPAPLRRRAVLLALTFSLVAIATTLWRRSGRAMIGIVVAAAVTTAGFFGWGARQAMVCEVKTGVSVTGASAATQHDHWTYARPLKPRDIDFDWSQVTKPIFASAAHLRQTDIRLHAGPAGRPMRFTWAAAPGTTLAFLSRGFDPAPMLGGTAARSVPQTPTRELVLDSYLQPGDIILEDAGDFPPTDDAADWRVGWPHVTVYRASAAPGEK